MGQNCSTITYSDDNLTEYVNQVMGPRCLDPIVTIVTVFFYSFIFILGFLGNFSTCIVILHNNYMHNATNYYLFSLAISDLISLVLGLPFEMVTTLTYLWPDTLPEAICKLRSFVTETTSAASVLTITAFSVERWLAICFPLKVKLFSKLERAIKVIIAIWLIACVSATPIAFFAVLNRIELPEGIKLQSVSNDLDHLFKSISNDGRTVKDTDVCALDFSRPHVSTLVLNLSFYCFFLLPMIIICVLFVHIGITIKVAASTQARMNDAIRHDARRFRRRLAVIRMLVSVVVCFFTCWLPFHVQRLSSLYFDMENVSVEMTNLFHLVFFVSGYFYYANSAVNPILYNVLNSRFRRAFVQTFGMCKGGSNWDSPRHHHTGDISRCVRSSCSSVVALIVTNQQVMISVASAVPLSVSTPFLNAPSAPKRPYLQSGSSVSKHIRPRSVTEGKGARSPLFSFRNEDNRHLRMSYLISASSGGGGGGGSDCGDNLKQTENQHTSLPPITNAISKAEMITPMTKRKYHTYNAVVCTVCVCTVCVCTVCISKLH